MARPRITRLRITRPRGDAGMATAEYAVATVAACGFAGVLIKLLSSHQVLQLLLKVLLKAFDIAF